LSRDRRIKVLVLDFDGVITPRINVDWEQVREEASRLAGFRITSLLEFYREFFDTSVFWRVSEFVKEHEISAAKESDLTPCMDELLKRASGSGVKVFIASMQAREPILNFLHKHGLEEYVTSILSREEFPGKWEMIRHILLETQVKPREILYVDDLERNIREGEKLGVKCLFADADKDTLVKRIAEIAGLNIECAH